MLDPKSVLIHVSNSGRIVSVIFVKRTTGEMRHMLCRRGVKKSIKNVGMSYRPDDKGLFQVWDIKAHGYRMIAIEGIVEIKGRGQTWSWDEPCHIKK